MKTSVYLGYEVSWQEAYLALTEADKRTKGMLQSIEPFVLQEELNEVYATYLLSVYIDDEYFQDKSLKDFEQAHCKSSGGSRDRSCYGYRLSLEAPLWFHHSRGCSRNLGCHYRSDRIHLSFSFILIGFHLRCK